MSKFFVEKSQIKNHKAVILGSDVSHIARVLRMGVGDALLLCDGEGYDYETKITSVSKDEIVTEILSSYPCKNEPEVEVTLFQGLPKQGKMEWIIEKCTELGISTIVPVQMTRSVVKLTPDQAAKKVERWQKTAREAAKQCGRGKIPAVLMPVTVQELVASKLPEFLLFPYEEERTSSVRQALFGKKAKTAGIFIGPEGGFDPEEAALLKKAGANAATLGPRILRTETAGLVALSALLYEWGEMESK